jgi:hypothetical protein
MQVGNNVMAGNPIPGGAPPVGTVLDDDLLIIVSGEAADSVYADEVGNRGEQDFVAVVAAQHPGAAEPSDCLKMAAHLRFVITLKVRGSRRWCPPTPDSRDLACFCWLCGPGMTIASTN